MTEDALRYDLMVENALRQVVQRALSIAAESGLPGNHHFYITFRTDHPDLELSDQLRERYPREMTIVLQHQFWGLEVNESDFQVTLSFSDKPEHLSIPFEAVTAFADPSVRFGLQFDSARGEEGAGGETAPSGRSISSVRESGVGRQTDKLPIAPADKAANSTSDKAKERPVAKKAKKEETGEIVSLDAFRKK